jgi:Divergent InlB B-repeat domain
VGRAAACFAAMAVVAAVPGSGAWGRALTGPVLVIAKEGNGRGRIRDLAHRIACRRTCVRQLAGTTNLSLRAKALPGSYFAGWSGACNGAAPVCSLTVSETTIVRATFHTGLPPPPPGIPLTLTFATLGHGRLVFHPAHVSCDVLGCSGTYAAGSKVVVRAKPAPGSRFLYWRRACRGRSSTCVLHMTRDRDLGAVFRRVYPLRVTHTGSGRVRSRPRGIDCGARCSARFIGTETATLTAATAKGARFVGWSGDCVGTVPTCVVATDTPRAVQASFATGPAAAASLLVTASGGGRVVSSPAGVDCGAICSAVWPPGTRVTLTPVAGPGTAFAGWHGACFAANACQLTTATKPLRTIAVFRKTYRVIVHAPRQTRIKIGPRRIDCGRICSATFPSGTHITLRATEGGWAAPCHGSLLPQCTFRLDGPVKAVLEDVPKPAEFVNVLYAVNVTTSGSGTVTSSPPGIKCSERLRPCAHAFQLGQRVTLHESAATGWSFGGWGGACTGRAQNCKVAPPIPNGVYARFRRQ